MKKTVLLNLMLIISLLGFSQKLTYKQDALKEGANYYEIISKTRAVFSEMDMEKLSNKKAQKQFERWAYYWRDRVNADGSFPPENLGYFNAGILDSEGKISESEKTRITPQSGSWVNIGPQTIPAPNGYPNYPQMGRLNAFLRFPHPTNMNLDVLFVGAPTGGVWKSTDGGANWTPVMDFVSGIGVTDIASASQTYSSNTVIYVSTGDYDSDQLKSIGVLKSTDGGNTFQSTGLSFPLSDQEVTSNLIVLSDDTVIVGTSDKILKTTDGGQTWGVKYQSQFTYENFGRFIYHDGDIVCIGQWGDIYFSGDRGENWALIKSGGNYLNKHAMYLGDTLLLAIDMNGQLSHLTQNGWQNLGNPVPNYDAQGGYNQTLLVENNMIINGDMNGYHSIDNGSTWYCSLNGYWQSSGDSGSYIHSDYHSMGKLDTDPNTYKYWACNDGGLSYIEYSSAGAFKPTITYKSEKCIVTQLYSVAITPNSNAGNMLQGNQDNDGFSREMHNGSMKWVAASAGDGTATAINYNNPNVRYLGGTNGGLTIANNGFSGNYQGDYYITIPGANFIWPLEMNTVNPDLLYAGGDDVYLLDASNGGSMNALNANTGTVSFISTHNNAVFAVGDNAVRKSLDGGQTWSSITQCSADPNALINSIDFFGTHPNIVYATVRGYVNGQKVFKSTDGGQTWNNISSGLPNILMKEVVIAQNEFQEVLYLATELGVYYKIGTNPWAKLGGNTLPNVIVNDIDINYTENALVAATFGRGLWQIDISSHVGMEEHLLSEKEKPNFYPNPITDDYINIKLPNSYSNDFSYLIYNVVGGIVKQGKLKEKDNLINLSGLSKGSYMIKVFDTNNESFTEKIIIK
jgi:photosystem II stability/assembly factor-like uncharacterized protein